MIARSADIVDEATRMVGEAAKLSISLRLLGGVGIKLRCPDASQRPELARIYRDIDVAASRRSSKSVRDVLLAEGYVPDSRFNALHGASRLLFYDEHYGRQVDVFLGTFEMCHKLDLEPRIVLAGPTLSPSDLLLLKLQVVELNEKDITDALTLLLEYEPGDGDHADALSGAYIARLCAGDWGWFTTLHDNVRAIRDRAPLILRAPADIARTQANANALLHVVESAPKSVGWRLRDKVGRRKIWYQLPEEVER